MTRETKREHDSVFCLAQGVAPETEKSENRKQNKRQGKKREHDSVFCSRRRVTPGDKKTTENRKQN